MTDLTTIVSKYDNISINFTTQLNSITSKFNNKIANLEKLISTLPTFPLSVNDMNYIDVNNQFNDIPTLLPNISSDYNSKISKIKSLYQCTDMSSEIDNQISALENKIPLLAISATQINYINVNTNYSTYISG
jgi:hypothetical protein